MFGIKFQFTVLMIFFQRTYLHDSNGPLLFRSFILVFYFFFFVTHSDRFFLIFFCNLMDLMKPKSIIIYIRFSIRTLNVHRLVKTRNQMEIDIFIKLIIGVWDCILFHFHFCLHLLYSNISSVIIYFV